MANVKFEDLTLLQDAYINNYGTNGGVRYCAVAKDDDGNEYEVIWDTTPAWDMACELAKLEAWKEQCEDHNDDFSEEDAERLAELSEKVNSSLCDDESNACDWDNPTEINEI